jgi:DNA-binding transcriptional MerR regulator
LDANALRSDTRKHRRFSELDVMRLYIISYLTSLGFEISRIADLFEYILVDQMWKAKASKQVPGESGNEWESPAITQPVIPFLSDKILTLVIYQLQYADEDKESAYPIGFIHKKGVDPLPEHPNEEPVMRISIDLALIIRNTKDRLKPEELERILIKRRYHV